MPRSHGLAAASLGAALLAFAPPAAPDDGPAAAPPSETVYEVVQTFEVKDLPADAKRVRLWTWMPEDRSGQKVLDFRVVEGPEGWRVTRDPGYGRLWLHADAAASREKPARFVAAFTLRRTELRGLADPARAGAVTDEHRKAFARELRADELHMEVTPEFRKIADGLCGAETNPVLQARRIYDFVIEKSEHYSKSGPDPKGKCLGDAQECLAGTGDCCTDQHALFLALCRARGIPCRLVFGSRLKMENEGKEHDPGYRCWPLFFAPGLGWVPVDVSSGDANPKEPERWFGGLDDRRIEWAEGRDFDLEPRSAVRPDLVIRGWVEVDGKVHKGFARTLKFTRK